MKLESYSHLVGKSRNQIKQEMGDGFNFFKDRIWTYEIGKTWIGKRIILAITFKEDKADAVRLFKSFKRC